ncbi:MAG: S1C family serine protease [Intestinimonas sp.]
MHPYYFDPPRRRTPEKSPQRSGPHRRSRPAGGKERQPAAHAGPAVRPTRRKSERGAALVLAALTLVLGGTAVLLALRHSRWWTRGRSILRRRAGLRHSFPLLSGGTGAGTHRGRHRALPGGQAGGRGDAPPGHLSEGHPLHRIHPGHGGEGHAQGVSQGTGILMSGDGYLITNAHVIDGAFRVDVSLEDGRGFQAKLVGSDSTTDLAVLKIEAEGLTPAAFGDSEDMVVGDAVVAIGNPMGEELRGTMTDGILSAINRGHGGGR